MICDDILCLLLVAAVLFCIICIPSSVGCCFYCCWYRHRRRVWEHYRRLLFEPVSVPILDDDSQRLLDESYESYPAAYSRAVNPGQLTPQDCMNHCTKIAYARSTTASSRFNCINELCTICLDDFKHQESVTVCPCHHGFHEKCLLGWFQKSLYPHYKCPICKTPVVQL